MPEDKKNMGFNSNLTLKTSILLVIQRNLVQLTALTFGSVGLSLAQLIAFYLNFEI